jgi:hypothetical protein
MVAAIDPDHHADWACPTGEHEGLYLGADTIDIGGPDHYLTPTSCHGCPAGVTGYIETHRRPDGEYCQGGVPLRGHGHGTRGDGSPRPEWDRVSDDPLELAPSILCRICGAHGWVRGGRWVDA